jgi:DNA polymerase III subunit epsilon
MTDGSRIIIFDLETTGTDLKNDQIIEIGFQEGLEENSPVTVIRIKPTIPIAPEAEAVHGIKMKDLEEEKPFSFYATDLKARFAAADFIMGYNVNFDLTILQAEFVRNGFSPLDETKKLYIDPHRIWQEMEPRKLSDAYRRFVGGEIDGAHSAAGDVKATVKVLKGMQSAFSLKEKPWKELSDLFSIRRQVYIGGTYHLQIKGGKLIFGFGKHRDKEVSRVMKEDASYFEWVVDKSDLPEHVKKVCREALEGKAG